MTGLGIVIPREGGGGPAITLWEDFATDDFGSAAGPSPINGRTLNNANGGDQAATWVTSQSAPFSVIDGALQRDPAGTTNAALAGVNMPVADYGITWKLTALPAGGNLRIIVRRTPLTGGTDDSLSISPEGICTPFAVSAPDFSSFTAGVGDRVGLRVKGTLVEFLKNGSVMGTATSDSSPATPGYAGLALASNVNYFVDDARITVPA